MAKRKRTLTVTEAPAPTNGAGPETREDVQLFPRAADGASVELRETPAVLQERLEALRDEDAALAAQEAAIPARRAAILVEQDSMVLGFLMGLGVDLTTTHAAFDVAAGTYQLSLRASEEDRG